MRFSRKDAKTQRTARQIVYGLDNAEWLMTENEIATIVVDVAYKMHVSLGPGLLESVYEVIFCHELKKRGLSVERQVPIPINYEGLKFEEGYRADLIVEGKVIVEIKSVEDLAPVHKKQVLTYLRLADKRLGLLVNFGSPVIKDGIVRLVNGLVETPRVSSRRGMIDPKRQ